MAQPIYYMEKNKDQLSVVTNNPQLLLAQTRNEETDYEGIRIVDIPRWLLSVQ